VLSTPVADAGNDLNICVGQDAKLNGKIVLPITNIPFDWTPSYGLSNPSVLNPGFIGDSVGSFQYVLTIHPTAALLCPVVSDTVNVNVHAVNLKAYVDTSQVLAGTEVHLSATGNGIHFQWIPGAGLDCPTCMNPTARPLHTTQYIVTSIDSFGCREQDTLIVNVEDIITLYVPNAFTPVDGRNPLFKASGIGVDHFDFYIFNRQGEKIFESHDLETGWDGTFKGDAVQQGVYVWLAKALSSTGKVIERTGSVTVVK
jgi:gliding motility-associated-like protein